MQSREEILAIYAETIKKEKAKTQRKEKKQRYRDKKLTSGLKSIRVWAHPMLLEKFRNYKKKNNYTTAQAFEMLLKAVT